MAAVFALKCSVQKYPWGRVGQDSEVARLLLSSDPSFKLDENAPYAELWMGTHPNGPSRIISTDAEMPLAEWVKGNQEKLGTLMQQKFKGELSFLFKVLSVNKALSIQAHPNLELAKKIHADSPDVYKDPNHKPEMALALTPFRGLCGFRPLQEIADFLTNIEELKTVVGPCELSSYKGGSSDMPGALKEAFSALMKQDAEVVKTQLTSLVKRVEEKAKAEEDITPFVGDVLLKVSKEFPGDVGCFAIYFLNVVDLNPGEAMYLQANLPHAYLSGDCIECMACSDNTIRAGLTPKFRDVDLLCQMLDYTSRPPEKTKFNGVQHGTATYFKPDIDDFMVTKYQFTSQSGNLGAMDSASICIVIKGEGQAVNKSIKNNIDLRKGSVVFISANEEVQLTITSPDMLIFRGSCSIALPSSGQ